MWLERVFLLLFVVISSSLSARSFLLTATSLCQLLLQCGRNELFRLGMIALTQQCRLNVFTLLYALYALQQIIIDALTDHRIFSVKERGNHISLHSNLVTLVCTLTCSRDAAAPVRVSRWLW